jgi:hypothetical protein
MSALTRRVLLRRILETGVSLSIVPAAIGAAAESCVDPSSESLRESLHYSSSSTKPGESCQGCGFFAGDTAKPSCGTCQIMSGPVDAGGHCDSWAAKSAS